SEFNKGGTRMKRTLMTLMGAATAALIGVGAAEAQVLFWSTQAAPGEETQRMREQVLAGFSDGVDFQPQETGPFITRLEAELEASSGSIGVVGALHGDHYKYADDWVDLSDVDLSGVTPSPAFMELGKLGTS